MSTTAAPRMQNPADSSADIALVTQVVLAERQGRDRGWWDQMAAQFWDDSSVRLSWYDGDGAGFVTGSAAMAERGQMATHHLFAPVVHVRGARAYVELSLAMRMTIEVDGVRGDLVSYTRLNYRLERREALWRILTLDAVYEYVTLDPSVPGRTIDIDPADLAPYRQSYALLAWNIAREGRTPSQDELGDDRPEELAAFYASIWAWLDAA
ncbi:nuclear transport factor 2 family protein [Streptomyces sp. NPDC008150]|uniref:nuclear transport factor 2 family protein n=1 Tax=Streptomyces sp. NPDC008150 TaxID=3364816 RepID=UPI0036EE6A4A